MKTIRMVQDSYKTSYRNAAGELHRNNGPAVIHNNGNKEWWINGERHRDDGPAIENESASTSIKYEWFNHGKLHREGGPAIGWIDGDCMWFVNGKLHREDGPAIMYKNGYTQWYSHGKRHRTDGPAVEYDCGEEWWLNGIEVTEEEVMGKQKPIENRVQTFLKRLIK